MLKTPIAWLILALLVLLLFIAFAPAEKTLGTNVRVVYLHGVWVWTALVAFLAAALVGLVGLLSKRVILQRWSRAFGRASLFFWISYLPLSLWAMQTSWNGLFLAEPRFRLALVFAIGGLLLQIGVTLLGNPAWACAGNIVYMLILIFALTSTENVMHPPSPILSSNASRIQFYFLGLLLITFFIAWQVTRLWILVDVKNKTATSEHAEQLTTGSD
jgi:hypothetical protein